MRFHFSGIVLMRKSLAACLLMLGNALPLAAQAQHAEPPKLLTANGGLMAWTLLIFLVTLVVLTKGAFKPITKAVEAREKALEDAIEAAKKDREEAAKLLEEHRKLVAQGRADAQRFVVEGRVAGEKVRTEIIEQAHREQQQVMERARHEIESERQMAMVELRRDAVTLAVRGASKVIEKNLDDETNRKVVESFLASLEPAS
ncbi:MAG TPA: F0F1 ATP synthase subunit B [Gemmatimonadaceae bacterium]|nr:F0F1 ATP synthase subunit B [Gemmatimonadaceae bacterium]